MSLVETFANFADDSHAARRVVFEAAMIEKLKTGPAYKISDLLYEVCECQADILVLQRDLEYLTARFDKKASRRPKEPKNDGKE